MRRCRRTLAWGVAGLVALAASAGSARAQDASACTLFAAPTPEGRVPVGEPFAAGGAAGTAEAPIPVAAFWKRGLAKPGAVLCLKDGLYRGDESMLVPPATEPLHGRAGKPVEVRALNDGRVWIDGQRERATLRVVHDHWTVAGVNAFDGVGPAVAVRGLLAARPDGDESGPQPVKGSVLRRVVAWLDFVSYGSEADYEALGGGDVAVFDVAYAEDALLEDCAGFGWGKKVFQVFRSQRVTLRRAWARWDGRHPYRLHTKFAISCSYESYDVLCENVIATAGGSPDEAAMPADYAPTLHLIATDAVGTDDAPGRPARSDPNALGLRILGSLAYLPEDARFSEVVGFHVGGDGYPVRGQKGVRIQNAVAWLPGSRRPALQLQDCDDDPARYPDGCAWSRGADRAAAPLVVRDVTVVSGAQVPDRIGADWQQDDVNVVVGGGSANVYRPRGGGASLCHRSVDGKQTSEPLWPWPMQERILVASERSRWETADVMGDLARLLGAPPAECRGGAAER